MYHMFFIHSFVVGHFGCFYVLVIVNSARVWKTSWLFCFFKLNIPLPYDLVFLFLDIYLKEMKWTIHIKTCS